MAMRIITTDPIADLLTRIRNGLAVSQDTIVLPYSKMKEAIVKLLKERNFITDYKVGEGNKELNLILFELDANSRITGLERISKPGRRVYVASRDIPKIMGGRGVVIVSTSKGVIDGEAAKQQGLGGELICKVW